MNLNLCFWLYFNNLSIKQKRINLFIIINKKYKNIKKNLQFTEQKWTKTSCNKFHSLLLESLKRKKCKFLKIATPVPSILMRIQMKRWRLASKKITKWMMSKLKIILHQYQTPNQTLLIVKKLTEDLGHLRSRLGSRKIRKSTNLTSIGGWQVVSVELWVPAT